jgi:hypothetical protein
MEVEILQSLIELRYIESVFSFVLAFIIIIAIISGISALFKTRKSEDYRKLICDLYVAGKTRLLAKNENLDLDIEYKEFLKWNKKTRRTERNNLQDLDKTIESEMKDKISESIGKETDKISEEGEEKK